jgi:hypothetical protein
MGQGICAALRDMTTKMTEVAQSHYFGDLDSATEDRFRAVLEISILAMLVLALPVDAVTGYLAGSGASFQSLSLVYKALVIALMLAYSARFAHRHLTVILVALAAFLGSVYLRVIITGSTVKALADAISIVKILTPLISILVLVSFFRASPIRAAFWTRNILLVSAVTVVFNILVGLLGYGYATYDFAAAEDVGSKGYFYAGNELSAVFVVIAGYVLATLFSRRSRLYWAAGAALLVFGLALGTKSAIIATFLLIMTIPLAYERGNLFRLTGRKILLFVLFFALLAGAYAALWSVLEAFGLAARIDDVIERRGVLGFVFSGREIYVASAISEFRSSAEIWAVLVGVGQTGVDALIGKGSVEIDVIDLFFWYGVTGLTYYFFLIIWILKLSAKNFLRRDFPYAPGVLVTSAILILQSATAGHVVVSGMLGIPWAALVCVALFRDDMFPKR